MTNQFTTSRRRRSATNAAWVAFFLAPSAVPLALFTLWPMLHSIWMSMQKWNLISDPTFIGLANYAKLLATPTTYEVLGHTFGYVLGYLPLVYFGGLALALALDARMPARAFFRATYFLPVITSWVVVALVWKWLLNPANGIVNSVLGAVGLPQPGWWTDPQWALASVVLASAWKDLGFVMVILLAGLQAIPRDTFEAATIDGASWLQRLRHVTLPLLSPSSFFVVVISLINGFQVFDQVFVMTKGGPQGSSQVLVGQVYDLTFRYGRAGEGAALSWLLFLLILAVTVVQLVGQKKWVHYA